MLTRLSRDRLLVVNDSDQKFRSILDQSINAIGIQEDIYNCSITNQICSFVSESPSSFRSSSAFLVLFFWTSGGPCSFVLISPFASQSSFAMFTLLPFLALICLLAGRGLSFSAVNSFPYSFLHQSLPLTALTSLLVPQRRPRGCLSLTS